MSEEKNKMEMPDEIFTNKHMPKEIYVLEDKTGREVISAFKGHAGYTTYVREDLSRPPAPAAEGQVINPDELKKALTAIEVLYNFSDANDTIYTDCATVKRKDMERDISAFLHKLDQAALRPSVPVGEDCGCGHPDRHREPTRQEKIGGGHGYYCRYCLTLRTADTPPAASINTGLVEKAREVFDGLVRTYGLTADHREQVNIVRSALSHPAQSSHVQGVNTKLLDACKLVRSAIKSGRINDQALIVPETGHVYTVLEKIDEAIAAAREEGGK